MPAGVVSKFNILQTSPHDLLSFEEPKSPDRILGEKVKWIPSRYNVRATTEDNRLILWNTFSGAMSIFRSEQAEGIKELLRKPGFESAPDGMVKYLADRGC